MTKATSKNVRYAVFGAGWGRDWLGAPGNNLGSGHIAYEGESLEQARKTLAQQQKSIRRMRKRAHMRNASDTYGIFATSDDYYGWVPLERFEA